jgi:hypothetical protein
LYLLLFILGIFISVTRLGVGRWAWVLGVLTLSAPNFTFPDSFTHTVHRLCSGESNIISSVLLILHIFHLDDHSSWYRSRDVKLVRALFNVFVIDIHSCITVLLVCGRMIMSRS